MSGWRYIVAGIVALLAIALVGCKGEAEKTPELQGIVELDERNLAFELPGRLLEVGVERGDVIERGVVLARLDGTLEEMTLESLVAQTRATKAELDLLYEGTRAEEIEQARARVTGTDAEVRARSREYERVKTLYTNDSVSQSELDSARGFYDQAVAARTEARERLKELRKGPRDQEIQAGEARLQAAEASARSSEERIRRHVLLGDGLAEVLDVPVRFGEYVAAGTTIATVADTTRPYVDMFVPQGRAGEVKVGQSVTVKADSLPELLGGRVEHIARTMEFSPRFLFSPQERPYLVLRVRVRVADPERKLRAGIPAFIELREPKGVSFPDPPVHRKARAAEDPTKGEK